MTRCGSCGGGGSGGGGGSTCTCFTTSNCEATEEFFVDLPGTSGNYISTPDSVANSVLGDIDIRIKVAMDDWTPAVTQALVSKFDVPVGSDAYRLSILSTGLLDFGVSSTGSGITDAEQFNMPAFVDGSIHWIRVTLDVDNGAGNKRYIVYTSSNGIIWNQVAAATTAGTTSIFDGTAPLQIGSVDSGTDRLLAGNVYYAEVRNGIDGPVVARFDPDDSAVVPVPTTQVPSSFTSSTGEVWTINGAAWVWGVTEGSSCVVAEGNGTLSHPFQFHSSDIPHPRPFGFIRQTVEQTNFDPAGASFIMPFNEDPTGINGGMVDLVAFPTRLTIPFDGVYMIGAFLAISADATDSFRARLRVNNGFTSNTPINLRVEIPSATPTRLYSLMTLYSFIAGDYFELVLDGSTTMDAIVIDDGMVTKPTMWAQWVGGA